MGSKLVQRSDLIVCKTSSYDKLDNYAIYVQIMLNVLTRQYNKKWMNLQALSLNNRGARIKT